jgi:RNA polymerase sigma-70 factor (ECF subfamily)
MTSIPDISDEQLIQQFVQGDLQAFDVLYIRYVKTVYNRVRFKVPRVDVEDVTQEVFLTLIGALPTFRGESQFRTWLYTLTNNKVAEYYRQQSRKNANMQVSLENAEQISDNRNAKSILEDRIHIRRALSKIHKTYREVILMRFADDMRFKEIADFQGQSLEATKSLFRRAMSALHEVLENDNEKNQKQ